MNNIIEIPPKEVYDNLPIQESPFEDYYEQFDTVRDLTESGGAWEDTWKYFY